MTNLAALWASLIVCSNSSIAAYNHACGYSDLILLAKNLITDLTILSTLLATAVFAFAGFKLLTSGGDPGAMSDAKKMLKKVLFGYLWILAAWLVVYTITSTLISGSGYSILGKP